jgi:tetratricopeptide (TPR) repeat protein
MGMEGKARTQARLDSWKEIAAHFGRDERTVKRWEGRRGLPVYRAPGGGKTTVYAYVGELDAWLRNDHAASGTDLVLADVAGAAAASAPARADGRWHRVLAAGAALLIICAIGAGAAVWMAQPRLAPVSANADANRFYRDGLFSWNTRTQAGLLQAIADFKRSIRADPNFAAAYAGLADCYNLLPEYTHTPAAKAFPAAKAAAERAIALDDRLAAAHRSLAYVDFWWSRDNTAALREFRRAIALDPNSAQTHHWYANALSAMGRFPDALREIDTAERLEPGSTALMADKGLLLVDASRVGEGIQILKQVENAQPQFAPAHAYLAGAYRSLRDGAAALREMRWHAQLTDNADALAVVAAGEAGYAAGGYREMTSRIAEKEGALVARGRLSPYPLAVDYYELGETDRALALLAKAIRRHDPSALSIRADPDFRGLHADPRFAVLVAKEGFTLRTRM